jgi:hypothetical protein
MTTQQSTSGHNEENDHDTSSTAQDICTICKDDDAIEPLIFPGELVTNCKCKVPCHLACLTRWFGVRGLKICPTCNIVAGYYAVQNDSLLPDMELDDTVPQFSRLAAVLSEPCFLDTIFAPIMHSIDGVMSRFLNIDTRFCRFFGPFEGLVSFMMIMIFIFCSFGITFFLIIPYCLAKIMRGYAMIYHNSYPYIVPIIIPSAFLMMIRCVPLIYPESFYKMDLSKIVQYDDFYYNDIYL